MLTPATIAIHLKIYEPELTRLESNISHAQGMISAQQRMRARYEAEGWPLPVPYDWPGVSDSLMARHAVVLAIVEGLRADPPREVTDPEVEKWQAVYEQGKAWVAHG